MRVRVGLLVGDEHDWQLFGAEKRKMRGWHQSVDVGVEVGRVPFRRALVRTICQLEKTDRSSPS